MISNRGFSAIFFGFLVGRVARARGQSTPSPATSPSTSQPTSALPINPVQNGTTFVACKSYGSGDGGKTCLRQGIPYVSTPDCDSQGGVNLPLPFGEENTTMCCFSSGSSCSAVATAVNLAISPTCNTSVYNGVFVTVNATDAGFATCSAVCLPSQYMIRYTSIDIAENGVSTTGPGMCAKTTVCPAGIATEGMCCSNSSLMALNGPDANGNASAIALARAANWSTAEICRPAVSCSSPDAQCLLSCDNTALANRTTMTISDDTCKPPVPDNRTKPSAGDDIAFGLMGLVLLAAAVIILMYVRRLKSTKADAYELGHNASLRERLLDAEIDRLRKAWEISEAAIVRTKLIARGAFATVWKGSWGHIPVAVKIPLGDWDGWSDPEAIKEFGDEASRLQSIRHPNLVTFYGAGTTVDAQPFLVFELMELGSLQSLLQSARGAMLDWQVRLRFAAEIAAGMQHLHDIGIIHRDLKPANCLVDSNMHTKVADFGSSTFSGTTVDTSPVIETALTNRRQTQGRAQLLMTQHVGTPLWRAPESMLGASEYGFPIDVWSFGIIMWELVTRTDPWADIAGESTMVFENNLHRAVLDGVRPALPDDAPCAAWYVTLMSACWATDPEERPDFHAVSKSLAAQSPLLSS